MEIRFWESTIGPMDLVCSWTINLEEILDEDRDVSSLPVS